MSDETTAPEPKRPRRATPEVIEDAVVVEDTTEAPATPPPAEPTKVEAVVIDSPAATGPQVVYIETPAAPKKKGNRGVGSALAVASGIVFMAVFALVVALIAAITGIGQFTVNIITQPTFFIPVLFYIIGTVLLVLIVNRAGWAAYVVGSIFVALLVYFGTVGVLLLGQGIILRSPSEAAELLSLGLQNPLVIAAALVAREVSLWSGALISRRGRKLKARNADARAAWEREVADTRAEQERRAAGASAAV